VFLLYILKYYIQFDSAFNSAQKDVFDIKIYRRAPEKNNFYRMRCIEIRDFPQFIRKSRPICLFVPVAFFAQLEVAGLYSILSLFPFPPYASLPRSGPLNQLGGLGERCELPQRVRAEPGRQTFLVLVMG
jgi:hypothetical protein